MDVIILFIVSACCCFVDCHFKCSNSGILSYLQCLLELYLYCYCDRYRPWCEQAFKMVSAILCKQYNTDTTVSFLIARLKTNIDIV